jgi:Mn2+/Fe2+ NRAMP family transporter
VIDASALDVRRRCGSRPSLPFAAHAGSTAQPSTRNHSRALHPFPGIRRATRTAMAEARIPEPPYRWKRFAAVGPGFLWMVSAAGSGELLFTPRMGALYGYQLLWALLVAVGLKWVITREIGRFTVSTGATLLEGFSRLGRVGTFALWCILVPQLFVAVTAIAGLAGSAATAVVLALPGDVRLWMVVATLSSTALIYWGGYARVEKTAMLIATGLALASVAAAVTVAPDAAALGRGLVPSLPPDVDYGEVLPWLGFMLSGAAGLIWYSFWIEAKSYGASALDRPVLDGDRLNDRDRARIQGWLKTMTLDCTVAVVGTLVVTLAFLILGTELLGPQKVIPQENRVAEVLGRLLGDVWGRAGFWFMVLAVFVGFWDTVLSDQDGHSRMFAAGMRAVRGGRRNTDDRRLQRVFLLILVTALPMALYLAVGQPVTLLKIAGSIEAVHIPIVTALVLLLNRRLLPPELAPSSFTFWMTVAAGTFFALFAGLYIYQLLAG